MLDRPVVLVVHAELAIHLPCKRRVKSRFGGQIVSRASREQLGSPLSNGGTSFPTTPHKTWEFGQYEWSISSDVVHFQQLMSFGLGLTSLQGADNSGSLIATPLSNSN